MLYFTSFISVTSLIFSPSPGGRLLLPIYSLPSVPLFRLLLTVQTLLPLAEERSRNSWLTLSHSLASAGELSISSEELDNLSGLTLCNICCALQAYLLEPVSSLHCSSVSFFFLFHPVNEQIISDSSVVFLGSHDMPSLLLCASPPHCIQIT